MPVLTRRDTLVMTVSFGALLPARGLAAERDTSDHQQDDDWAELAETCREMSRDGELVVARARAHGMKVEDFSGLYMDGAARHSRRLVLIFGDWREPGNVVHRIGAGGIEQAPA